MIHHDCDRVAQAHRHVGSGQERFACVASMEQNFAKRHRRYCVAAGATNAASQSLSWDLAIACLAGLLWIFFESKRLGLRFFWIYIILAFSVAYAFAFPLFLFVRQGKLESMQNQQT